MTADAVEPRLVDFVEELDSAHRALVNAAHAASDARAEWQVCERDAEHARRMYMQALARYEAHRGRLT